MNQRYLILPLCLSVPSVVAPKPDRFTTEFTEEYRDS